MTQVIIEDILPLTQIVSVAGQTVYSTDWTVNYPTDVVVYYTPVGVPANDVTQILSPSQYNVALIGDELTVQVTLVTPAINTGDLVTITRQTPADRENLYTNTNFTPSMLNNDFGILTLVDQQNQLVDQQRAPHYNYSALVSLPLDIILPILGANQTWVKNPTNTAIIATTLPSSGLAPAGDTYVLLTPDAALPNSLALSTLPTGFMVNSLPGNTITTTSILGTTNQIGVTNTNGLGGGTVVSIAPNPIIPGTAGLGIPIGTTAQRVIPFGNINLRYNTTLNSLEYYNGTTWVQLAGNTNVQPGLINQLAWYAATGDSVSGLPTATSAVLTTVIGVPTWASELSLALGGTNAVLTASVGGIVYSTASQLAILSGTSTALLPLLSADDAAPAWGAFPLSLGGALTTAAGLTTAGAFNATFNFTAPTNVTFPTSGTLATTSLLPTYPLSPTLGGTGVNNGSNTITLGGSLTTAGAFNATFNFVGATNVTFPTTGTLATTSQLGIVTINGDTGSVTGTTVSITAKTTAGSSVSFSGSGTTLSLNLSDSLANTILGHNAGNSSITGTDNIGIGGISFFALTSGFSNVSIGYSSAALLTTGNNNVFLGQSTGARILSGSYNIISGSLSGNNYTSSESSNILLNNIGVLGESNTLRISSSGTGNQQVSTAYIGGIFGVTLAGTPSLVTSVSGDQLGTLGIGSGLSVVAGNLTAVSSGIITIDGDTGSVTGSTITIKANATAGETVSFSGSGTTLSLNVTDSNSNTFIGGSAGKSNAGNQSNTSLGSFSMHAINGASNNASVGGTSLAALTVGGNNTAIGVSSGAQFTNGSYNALLGYEAGYNYTGAESSNVLINNKGTVGETNVLRISATGTGNQQVSKAFIGGIYNVAPAGTVQVALVGSGDQMGGSTTLPAALTIPQPVIQGITTGTGATTGQVGQIITVPFTSVSLSNGTPANLTSTSLPAGNWIGFASANYAGGAALTFALLGIGQSSATLPTAYNGFSGISSSNTGISAPTIPINLSTATTIYLVTEVGFSSGSATATGVMYFLRIS